MAVAPHLPPAVPHLTCFLNPLQSFSLLPILSASTTNHPAATFPLHHRTTVRFLSRHVFRLLPRRVGGSRRDLQRPGHGGPQAAKGLHHLQALRQPRAQDGQELPRALHPQERLRLQGLQVPPHHPAVHAPGWRLHPGQRHRRQVHLRREVRRREAGRQARPAVPPVHGQRRPQHQRLAIFRHDGPNVLARRQARRVRRGPQRAVEAQRQEDRGHWHLVRQHQVQVARHHCRLRHGVVGIRAAAAGGAGLNDEGAAWGGGTWWTCVEPDKTA